MQCCGPRREKGGGQFVARCWRGRGLRPGPVQDWEHQQDGEGTVLGTCSRTQPPDGGLGATEILKPRGFYISRTAPRLGRVGETGVIREHRRQI